MSAARTPQQGFTYLGLLMAVVVMGLMLTIAGRVWSTTEQRERETQLLLAGHAYRMAISSYYATGHQFPATLQDLLLDERFPVPVRHLRRLYMDPMTGAADWTLIPTPSGTGIMGVVSSSQRVPIKRKNFEALDNEFTDAECYCNWRFIYYPNRYNRLLPRAPSTSLQPGSAGTPDPAASTVPTVPANTSSTDPTVSSPSTP